MIASIARTHQKKTLQAARTADLDGGCVVDDAAAAADSSCMCLRGAWLMSVADLNPLL